MSTETQASSVHLYTKIQHAIAVAQKETGVKVISCKRKKSVNCPEGFERAIILPSSYFQVSEKIKGVNPKYHEFLELSLLELAGRRLLKFSEKATEANEIPCNLFLPDNLLEWSKEDKAESMWINKEELEAGFKSGKTWERISSREEFKNKDHSAHRQYHAMVNQLLEQLLKFSAKNCTLTENQIDRILVKLDPQDLDTDWGTFIAFRAENLKKKLQEVLPELDFDML